MKEKSSATRIGFIGAGVMGKSMARNLMKAGYHVSVYTRTKSKANELLEEGAKWCDTIAALAGNSDVVITIVGYPQDVEEIYFGAKGLIQHGEPGTILIDMTTSSPLLAQQISEKAEQKGMFTLDAPVSGGDIGAKEARLSIMVGGDKNVFERVYPLLQAMGNNIVLQGGAGAGQHTKMCNQIAIASGMMGMCEALIYAKQAALEATTVLKSIESGAAGSWSLSNLAPRVIAEDFSPGFFVKHFIKDMSIALSSAEKMGLKMPGLKQAKTLYEELAEMGEQDSGTQALYKWYDIHL